MDRIQIHWMTLIVSIVLLVVLLGGLVREKIKDRHFRKQKEKDSLGRIKQSLKKKIDTQQKSRDGKN